MKYFFKIYLKSYYHLTDFDHCVIYILSRVYVDGEDSEHYQNIFEFHFQEICRLTGRPMQFQHIYNTGIAIFGADIDPAQIKGKIFVRSLEDIIILILNIYL